MQAHTHTRARAHTQGRTRLTALLMNGRPAAGDSPLAASSSLRGRKKKMVMKWAIMHDASLMKACLFRTLIYEKKKEEKEMQEYFGAKGQSRKQYGCSF